MVLIKCCDGKCPSCDGCSADYVIHKNLDPAKGEQEYFMHFNKELVRYFKGNKQPKYCFGSVIRLSE